MQPADTGRPDADDTVADVVHQPPQGSPRAAAAMTHAHTHKGRSAAEDRMADAVCHVAALVRAAEGASADPAAPEGSLDTHSQVQAESVHTSRFRPAAGTLVTTQRRTRANAEEPARQGSLAAVHAGAPAAGRRGV